MSALRYANERLAEHRGNARLAVLVGDDLHYGIIRTYEALGVTPNLELRVFRDEGEATDWLLQSPPADAP